MPKDGRRYKPSEPKGKPYFFYLVIPPQWNNGGYDDIYCSLINPNRLNETLTEKIRNLVKRKNEGGLTDGKFGAFKKVFTKFDRLYNINWFSSLEDGTWLDFQASDLQTANGVLESLFGEVESELVDFPLTPRILSYDEHHRRGLLIESRYTLSYTSPATVYHRIFSEPFNMRYTSISEGK